MTNPIANLSFQLLAPFPVSKPIGEITTPVAVAAGRTIVVHFFSTC
jgi:hypothetical protein